MGSLFGVINYVRRAFSNKFASNCNLLLDFLKPFTTLYKAKDLMMAYNFGTKCYKPPY